MLPEIQSAFAAVPDLAIGAVAGFAIGVALTAYAPKLLAAGKSAIAGLKNGAAWVRDIPARANAEKARLLEEAKVIAAKVEAETVGKAEAAKADLAHAVAAAVAAELAKLQVTVAAPASVVVASAPVVTVTAPVVAAPPPSLVFAPAAVAPTGPAADTATAA